MMKKIKIGLLPRIILAIALGIAFGNILPGGLVRIFVTFNGIFSEFLGFIIPLIILGLVTPAIADIGKEAGKMLVVTTLIAYGATLFSGFLSYFTGITFFPSMITPGASIEQISEAHDIVPFFTVAIPPVMNVMTSLILAFTLGLGIAHLNTTALKDVCNDFKDIIIKTIQVIILPLLPIYIFGIFLNMTHSGQVMNVLSVFIKIIGVIFLLHIFLLIFQYSIAALFVRRNPFRLLGRMLPAYFTALGTQSSAATIPVTLRQSIKNGVSEDIAGFVIPLCATIHLSNTGRNIVNITRSIITTIKTLPITIAQPIVDITLHFDAELFHLECPLIETGLIPFHIEVTMHIEIEIELIGFLFYTGHLFKEAFIVRHEITF